MIAPVKTVKKKVKKKVKKVKKVKKKVPAKESIPKELLADHLVPMPDSLLRMVELHITAIHDFHDWQEKKDPVGQCVLFRSMVALLNLISYSIRFHNIPHDPKEEAIVVGKCACYSPFHNQILGYCLRPFIRLGSLKGEKNIWRCACCYRGYSRKPTRDKMPVTAMKYSGKPVREWYESHKNEWSFLNKIRG